MLYFAYGSNLNHHQMKRRCKDSKYIKNYTLKNYILAFRSKYGAADIKKKKGSKVVGAIYRISKPDEKKLDIYEEYPRLYKKLFFNHYDKKVMAYIMPKKTKIKKPNSRYLNTIKRGYRDCKLNESYLKKALKSSW